MTHHDLLLAALAAWCLLLGLATVQLAAETRWRRRCARAAPQGAPRTEAPAPAAVTAPRNPSDPNPSAR